MTSNQLSYWRNVETKRANLAAEAESKRHNLQAEAIGRGQIAASFAATAAQRAAIASNERIAAANLAENARYHDLTYSYQTSQVATTQRGQDLSLLGNIISTAETSRHNVATEYAQNAKNMSSAISTMVGVGTSVAGLIMGTVAKKATTGLPTWQRP